MFTPVRLDARIVAIVIGVLVSVRAIGAMEYVRLDLHERVQLADIVVVARVIDPERAQVKIVRLLKGDAASDITLVDYIDGFMTPAQQKPLVKDDRELMFLRKKGNGYAPVQDQFGRLSVRGKRVAEHPDAKSRSLDDLLATIARLVAFQAQTARSDAEADSAYRGALNDADREVQKWALATVSERIKLPSDALSDAVIAHWPKDAGLIANTVTSWRLERAAGPLAQRVQASNDRTERGWAANALGGAGDRTYLPLLRRIASTDRDPHVRAEAYIGIRKMLGPGALEDLRGGARDPSALVRGRVVVEAYSLLELRRTDGRWPPASDSLIAEVRAFLEDMERDPAPVVRSYAWDMLRRLPK